MSVFEIGDQLRIFLCFHFSRPRHFRAVDISPVVHPFLVGIVMGGIAHDDQMLSALLFQSGEHLLAREVLRSGMAREDGFLSPSCSGGSRPDEHHEQADGNHAPYHASTFSTSTTVPYPDAPYREEQQGVPGRCHRREIMRVV